jgi:hypothetical protein
MTPSPSIRLRGLLIGLVVGAGGCGGSGFPTHSAFFAAGDRLQEIVMQSAPPEHDPWEWGEPVEDESTTPARGRDKAAWSLHVEFRSDGAGVDLLLRALRTNLEKEIVDQEGTVFEAKETAKEGRLQAFAFQYQLDAGTGRVRADVRRGESMPYRLTLTVDETVTYQRRRAPFRPAPNPPARRTLGR